MSVLVAVGINSEGYRELLDVAEESREDKESWQNVLLYLKERGLYGVKLIVSDKSTGLVEVLGDFFPKAKWQRCAVHWYRNGFSKCPKHKSGEVAAMLNAIHAQDDKDAARQKAAMVADKLRGMKLNSVANFVEKTAEGTLSYMDFLREYWTCLRTNNGLERVMKEIRRRTRVVGAFPDGNSALMLVCARLEFITRTKCGFFSLFLQKQLDFLRNRGYINHIIDAPA